MRTRHLIACGLAALSLAAAGCGEETAEEARSGSSSSEEAETDSAADAKASTKGDFGKPPTVTIPAGAEPPAELEIENLAPGEGPKAKSGDKLTVNYHGVSFATGEVFDSSFGREPLPVPPLGSGGVIPGFEQGLEGMKVGGRRQVTIPPDLAYGAQGSPPEIGPNETLVFVLDLVKIN